MNKKIFTRIGLTILILVVIGVAASYIDSGRVTTNHEPILTIKMIDSEGGKVTYWGLGYKAIRYVGVSPKEPYEMNIGAKMGSWFMKYELPNESITIEYGDKRVVIDDHNDLGYLKNILENSRYELPTCDGVVSFKIILSGQAYYLKENCQALIKGDKQSEVSDSDMDAILKIIEKYV